jgi:serine phosphatase RsbU (regulator of sigma subunit)
MEPPPILIAGHGAPPSLMARRPTLATDLDEALAQVSGGGFGIVLVDGSGVFPLLSAVAKLAEAAPTAAVVVWTSRSREAEAARALSFGAVDYLLAEDLAGIDLPAFLAEAASRRQAEHRLNARAQALAVSEPGPGAFLWETDARFRFTWFSRSFRARHTDHADRAFGRTFWELDAFRQPDEFWTRFRSGLSGRKPFRDLLFGLPSGGQESAAFRIEGQANFDAAGNFIGYAGSGVEVSHEVWHSLRLARVHEHLMDTHEALEAFRARVEEDLRAARGMQEELLPRPEDVLAIQERYGVTIEAHFETSSELGGDIWGARAIDDDRFALFVADFSGHGVTAALNTFRLHTVLESLTQETDEPGAYLRALNRRMAALLPTGQYATMLYAVIDVRKDLMRYAAAAAPRPLMSTGDGAVTSIDGSGLPLGVTKSIAYETREVPFASDGLLFLYSDALLECGREKGLALGKQGVADLIRDAVSRHGPDVPLQTILAPFFARVDRPLSDDLTAVRCHRKPRP